MTIAGTFIPRGAYDNSTNYDVGDMVDYQGSSYIMYNDASAGTLPTDTSYWGLVAEKGDTGATGPNEVTTATLTDINGLLKGDGANVSAATEGTDYYEPGGTDVAVADGGTGASTASGARTNLGVEIGTDVQAHSSVLDATTASFTTAKDTKLTGIEAGAQVNTVDSVAGKTGAVTLDKSDVGLGNVDNTSDANKPVSTATQTALNGKENTLSKGNIIEGTNVTLSGTLTNRLVGSGDVTINASGGGAVDSVNGQTGVVVLDTDDVAEGTANLYSQWTRGTNTGFNYIRPDTGTDQLLIGNTTDLSKFATFADAKALFLSENPVSYFVNSSTADPSFVTLGGAFLGTRARGTIASPTAVQANDQIATFAGIGYDGTDYAAGTSDGFVFGAYVEATAVTAGEIDQAWRWKHVGGSPVFEITSGGQIGFHGVTPVARSTGWAVTNVTSDKVFDANATTVNELADVVGTLINDLIAKGILGA
jgi:hypothetical protein